MSQYYLYLLTVLLLGYSNAFQPDYVEYDGLLTIKLYHTFEDVPDPKYTERGVINVQSIRTGAVALQQTALSAQERQQLKALADEGGYYRLRSIVRTLDGKETDFLTFAKACALMESHLSDTLTVSLDHTGTAMAVSMSIPIICERKPINNEDLRHFNTTVFIKHMEQGPVPDTAAYIQKLEKEREARERGETKDNRSFLAKYWMYIVPVVIFVVLSGAANPEGGAGAGGGGAGR